MKARRASLVLGMLGVLAGAGLLTAAFALAAGVGSEPGNLILSAATGSLASTPTWRTTDACPGDFQTSANIAEFTAPGGVRVSSISGTINTGLTAPFGPTISGSNTGALDGNVGELFQFAGISPSSGGTVEWVVGCWNGPGGTGTVKFTQSIFVSVAAGASTYTTSAPQVSATPGGGMSSSDGPSPSMSPPPAMSPSPAKIAATSASRSSTPTATPSLTTPPASAILPSGAAATGVGGSSGSGPNGLLIALGATVVVALVAATGLAVWRHRRRTQAGTTGGMAPDLAEDK